MNLITPHTTQTFERAIELRVNAFIKKILNRSLSDLIENQNIGPDGGLNAIAFINAENGRFVNGKIELAKNPQFELFTLHELITDRDSVYQKLRQLFIDEFSLTVLLNQMTDEVRNELHIIKDDTVYQNSLSEISDDADCVLIKATAANIRMLANFAKETNGHASTILRDFINHEINNLTFDTNDESDIPS